jgi:hypothetical protein
LRENDGDANTSKLMMTTFAVLCQKTLHFGKIFATKERKERIDNNLDCSYSLGSFVLFCGKFVFGCGLPRRAFGPLRLCVQCLFLTQRRQGAKPQRMGFDAKDGQRKSLHRPQFCQRPDKN